LGEFILSEQDQENQPTFQNCFEFPDCTIEEVEELKQKIKNVKWYRIDKKLKLSYQLYQLQKPVLFLVAKELAEQTLSQWIVTEQFRKNMLEASKELQSGVYTNISKIIAHITLQPNETYNEKTALRREKVFENLPLSLANQIANFFLLMFHELQKNMQTYSEVEKMTTNKMTTTQQKKK
jgi:hypothetical protein